MKIFIDSPVRASEFLPQINNETFAIFIETQNYLQVNYTVVSKNVKKAEVELRINFPFPHKISANMVNITIF